MSMFGKVKAWVGGEKEEHPAEPAAAEAEAAAAKADAVSPTPPVVPEIDFVAVLTAAGIQPEVLDRVVKARQLLGSMPADTPNAAKRQIVEAAFKAFEIPTQKIIDGAAAEVEALHAYIKVGEAEKAAKLADGERRIATLEGEIRDARAAMDLAVAGQERRLRLTTAQIETVLPVVQFFANATSAPAPSNGDAPKAEAKTEAKAEPKAEPKAEAKAEPKAEPKAAAHSANPRNEEPLIEVTEAASVAKAKAARPAN